MKKNIKIKIYMTNFIKYFMVLILSFLLTKTISAHPGPEPHHDLPYNKEGKKKRPVNNGLYDNNPNKQAKQNQLGLECDVTPSLKHSFVPLLDINKNANLYRKTGSAYIAKGVYTVIKGVVRDEECLPVTNALIEIWQTDSSGKYDKDYKVDTKWDIKDSDYDENFAYTGSARTNNFGQFSFLTIMPKARKRSVAHLNIKVIHNKFEDLDTRLFFKDIPRNKMDKDLKNISSKKRKELIMSGKPLDETGRYFGLEYTKVITLRGIHAYKEH